MDARLLAALVLVGLAAAAYPTLGAPPGVPQERAFTLEVTAVPCPQQDDGVCLAYNGQVPGPTLDINVGDTLVITLVNRIPETIGAITDDAALVTRLSAAPVSWHVHGTAVPNEMDGIDAHAGTNLVRSVAEPSQTFTYRTRAAFAGAWHYHDHVLGFDGAEGVDRGLYGGLLVRNGAELRPDATLDLHLLDEGANGGRGADATVAAGSSFEILVVGLENILWTVELRAPDGSLVGTTQTGPGLSSRFLVEDAQPGEYAWRAVGLGIKTGKVVVS